MRFSAKDFILQMVFAAVCRRTNSFLIQHSSHVSLSNCAPNLSGVYNDGKSRISSLYMSSTSSLPDLMKMRVKELRSELESYGMSTKSYFEKSELVDAVQ